MRAILFIGTNKSGSSREAIRAAEKLGFYTILLTLNKKQLIQRSEYPDVHLMKLCNIEDFEEMKSTIINIQKKGIKIKAITSFVDGRCGIANRLAKEFGLKFFTVEAICKMEDKLQSRKAIMNTKYCPKFISIEPDKECLEENMKDFFPAIIKSPKSAGSNDVYKVDDYASFMNRLSDLKKKVNNLPILLEEYLEGPQFITEVLVINNEIHIIGIIEQEISFINNHFIVTGYYLLHDKPSYYDELYNAVCDIINLHGLKFGSCHLELRLVNGIWKLIEINPRISGGGMNKLIEFGTGINLVEQTLNLLLDNKIEINPKLKRYVYAQYTTSDEEGILEKVTGVNKARDIKDVLSIYIKPRKGNKITLPFLMGNRYAYVISTGIDRNEAEISAKLLLRKSSFILLKI